MKKLSLIAIVTVSVAFLLFFTPRAWAQCRVTGGGIGLSFINGFVENASQNSYSFSGTAFGEQPQPLGEWTHKQISGPAGKFTFHAGTKSSPPGTGIYEIRCSDPGFCNPARQAPNKQIDFDGIGTFKNIGANVNGGLTFVAAEVTGNQNFTGTYHYFEVNIDDLGEPGNEKPGDGEPAECPAAGFGEKASVELADCDCSDFYRITIYDGVAAADVIFLTDGSIDLASMNRVDVIYEVSGYLESGNLQISPPLPD